MLAYCAAGRVYHRVLPVHLLARLCPCSEHQTGKETSCKFNPIFSSMAAVKKRWSFTAARSTRKSPNSCVSRTARRPAARRSATQHQKQKKTQKQTKQQHHKKNNQRPVSG